MSRWLLHWGLRESPFTKETSDAELWVPAARAAAIERLVQTCHERGHAVLARVAALSDGARTYEATKSFARLYLEGSVRMPLSDPSGRKSPRSSASMAARTRARSTNPRLDFIAARSA